jgi:hypothetical protein
MTNKPSNIKSTPATFAAQSSHGPDQQATPKVIKFVVTREGLRVSDKDYQTINDPDAIAERDYWQKIANKWSYGERCSVVQYDSKWHRVW